MYGVKHGALKRGEDVVDSMLLLLARCLSSISIVALQNNILNIQSGLD